jgi:hypothetical protein
MTKNKSEKNLIKIYKGASLKKKKRKYPRAVVFDLDETLGSFSDLHILWNALQDRSNKYYPVDFNKLLDLYPEFIRYGIIYILELVYKKKQDGLCDGLYIYTNNQCSTGWVTLITNYFNYKLNITTDLFDKIIYAFKINNKRIEPFRTTHDKTPKDFISCTMLPRNTEICFIDNSQFSEMKTDRVYYIQPRSFSHVLSTKQIIDRFCLSGLHKDIRGSDDIRQFLHYFFSHKNAVRDENNSLEKQERDILIAQKIMFHVKEFFIVTEIIDKTRRRRSNFNRITRKKY